MYSANYVRLTSEDDAHDDNATTMILMDHQSTADASYPMYDLHSKWSLPTPTAAEAHPPIHDCQHSEEHQDLTCHCSPFHANSSWREMSESFFQPQLGRENHLYFGCCCDVRRAVVAVNLLTILLLFSLLVSFEVYVRIMHEPLGNLTEEIFPEGWHNIHRNHLTDEESSAAHHSWFLYMLQQYMDVWILVGIILHSVGVYGAIKFECWAVQVAAIAHAVPLVLSVVYFSPIMFVVSGALCLYPHLVLLKEIKEGVMRPYKYEHVSACCVCV